MDGSLSEMGGGLWVVVYGWSMGGGLWVVYVL